MYSLSKTEEIVCRALEIQPEDRVAFSAKVKYYRRRNFPELPKTGKGNKSEFSERAAFQLMTVFRLEQLGFLPQLAIKGAIAASDAVSDSNDLPMGPYLCFVGDEVSVISVAHVHQMIDNRKSASFVSISEALNFFKRGVAEVTLTLNPPAEPFMSIVDHILEHRDGDK